MSVMESQAVDVIDVHVYRAERRLDWHANDNDNDNDNDTQRSPTSVVEAWPYKRECRGHDPAKKKKNLLH